VLTLVFVGGVAAGYALRWLGDRETRRYLRRVVGWWSEVCVRLEATEAELVRCEKQRDWVLKLYTREKQKAEASPAAEPDWRDEEPPPVVEWWSKHDLGGEG